MACEAQGLVKLELGGRPRGYGNQFPPKNTVVQILDSPEKLLFGDPPTFHYLEVATEMKFLVTLFLGPKNCYPAYTGGPSGRQPGAIFQTGAGEEDTLP